MIKLAWVNLIAKISVDHITLILSTLSIKRVTYFDVYTNYVIVKLTLGSKLSLYMQGSNELTIRGCVMVFSIHMATGLHCLKTTQKPRGHCSLASRR